jgi:hypothetical protein
VLAHELAHLVRRDGVVFPLVGLVQSLGWLQPFNHWIAAGFRHAAELACDDRAIELTGDRVALARALARAAQAAVPMLPAMARPRAKSALVERVRRLVAVQERTRSHVRSGWAVVCCAALAAGTVGVSVRAARPAVADASDASATEQIADLMAHAERVERELATLQSVAGHAEPRVLNLQQELRHVRETAAWIERRSSGQASP